MTPNLKLLLMTCSSKVTMRREACRERVTNETHCFCFSSFSYFVIYMGIQPINNVVTVSGT